MEGGREAGYHYLKTQHLSNVSFSIEANIFQLYPPHILKKSPLFSFTLLHKCFDGYIIRYPMCEKKLLLHKESYLVRKLYSTYNKIYLYYNSPVNQLLNNSEKYQRGTAPVLMSHFHLKWQMSMQETGRRFEELVVALMHKATPQAIQA